MTKSIVFFCIVVGTSSTSVRSCVSDYLKNNGTPMSAAFITRSRSIKIPHKTIAHAQPPKNHTKEYPELIVDLSLDPNIDTRKHNFEEKKTREIYTENYRRLKTYLKTECHSLDILTIQKIIARFHILMLRLAADSSQKPICLKETHTQTQENTLSFLHTITEKERTKQLTVIRSPVELKICPFPNTPHSHPTPNAMDTSDEFSPVFEKS